MSAAPEPASAGGVGPLCQTDPGTPAGSPGFFRNPPLFEALRETVFPSLARGRESGRTIRVWVPGCSTGEDVYSLAIALAECLDQTSPGSEFQMFGTDPGEPAIRRARAAVYDAAALAGVSPERIRRFFDSADGRYRVVRRIRDRCVFSPHDISQEAPLARMDLIVCRNLLGGLPEPLRPGVLVKLGYALNPLGYLVLDASERPDGAADIYDESDGGHGIYTRRPGPSSSTLDLPAKEADLPHATAPPKPAGRAARMGARTPGVASADEPALTREYLQGLVEELCASIEEGECANVELRSINAELATARQELEASNRELKALTFALTNRNAELSGLNDDLGVLLDSANVAIVLIDRDAGIRRFTPKAARLLQLAASDVGRRITDLRLPFDLPDLGRVLTDVQESLAPHDWEVRNERGSRYLVRVKPSYTAGRRVQGTVLELLDAGALKRDGEDVREARRHARAIVESARHPIVLLDRNFLIRDANQSFYEAFGLSPANAVGRSIYRPRQADLEIPRVPEVLDRLRAGEANVDDLEIEIAGARGTRYLLLSGRHLQTEDRRARFLLTFRDITGQKLAAEARYRRLFETARDGIAILDAESARLVDVNPSLERLSGYSREEIIGRTPWEIGPGRELPEVRSMLARIREEGATRVPEQVLRNKDGRHILIEILANTYSERDRTFIQLNIRDITERKKFEVDLLHTQKLESLGLLAGGIAHDFNNLLTGVLGNASLAYGNIPIDSPLRPQLREIMRAAERAAFLTRQMLAYAGKGRFVVERLELGDLIREVSALIRTSIPKTVEVGFDIAPDLPPIEADPCQMQQLIMNLVINGAEAIGENRPGRVDIHAALRRLSEEEVRRSFAAERIRPGAYVHMAISDNGSGMDDRTRTRIFDPFFTTKFTGRGLGLAAVMGIVKGHGGAIRVASALGQGTTFEVLLPAAEEPAVSEDREPRVQKASRDATVLVIDDEEIVRNIARAVLERVGFHVLTAENGLAGVEMFREHHQTVSLVVLDLLMPGMGGEEALDQLHRIDPGVPVVLSSGFDETEAGRRFEGKRLAGFIQKPYDIERLVNAICAALPGGCRM